MFTGGNMIPSATVHRSIEIKSKVQSPKSFDDYEIIEHPLEGLTPEVIEGR